VTFEVVLDNDWVVGPGDVHNIALSWVIFHQPLPFPLLKTVDILLECSAVGIVVNFTIKDTIICKEMDTGVYTVVEVIDKDGKRYRTQDCAQGNSWCNGCKMEPERRSHLEDLGHLLQSCDLQVGVVCLSDARPTHVHPLPHTSNPAPALSTHNFVPPPPTILSSLHIQWSICPTLP
jgi:hypothetical protein